MLNYWKTDHRQTVTILKRGMVGLLVLFGMIFEPSNQRQQKTAGLPQWAGVGNCFQQLVRRHWPLTLPALLFCIIAKTFCPHITEKIGLSAQSLPVWSLIFSENFDLLISSPVLWLSSHSSVLCVLLLPNFAKHCLPLSPVLISVSIQFLEDITLQFYSHKNSLWG